MAYNLTPGSTPTPSGEISDMEIRMPNVEDISKLIKTFRAGNVTKKSKFLCTILILAH